MDDLKIISLLEERNEDALAAIQDKYSSYLKRIAMNILANEADADECVNDMLLAAWNSIPPQKPDDLGSYVSGVTRNISTVRLRKNRAAKRGGGEADIAIDELEDCLAGTGTTESEIISREFTAVIEKFLDSLSRRERDMFVSRYYYAYPTDEIAAAFGISDGYVRAALSRTRTKLVNYLSKEKML